MRRLKVRKLSVQKKHRLRLDLPALSVAAVFDRRCWSENLYSTSQRQAGVKVASFRDGAGFRRNTHTDPFRTKGERKDYRKELFKFFQGIRRRTDLNAADAFSEKHAKMLPVAGD